MCTTCGCAAGNVTIEQRHNHDHQGHNHSHDHHHDHHEHSHSHGHDHHHGHHEHSHSHGHDHHHDHQHDDHSHAQVIHHHHYHAPVHVHYHADTAPTALAQQHNEDLCEPYSFIPQKNGEDLHYGQGAARSHAPGMTQSRMVQIETDILSKNDHIAALNRFHLEQKNINAFNLVSSPGSGKTTLLTETLKRLDHQRCAVIEGDQQTTNDADRIRQTSAQAIQINTGKGCHLDADMVAQAIEQLDLKPNSTLFIENVGNLVCPAAFDLGESHKIAILSVTEGEDKPLKYPDIFANADLMIINKVDLLPHLNFDLDACINNAKRVNPDMEVILVSASSGEGMQTWLSWLEDK